ncbi:MAG: fibronectin type III-like domain-contianing protein [Pseudomonadota bacterium]
MAGRNAAPVLQPSEHELAPGASERIEVKVDPRLLARYDADSAMWRIAAGNYESDWRTCVCLRSAFCSKMVGQGGAMKICSIESLLGRPQRMAVV